MFREPTQWEPTPNDFLAPTQGEPTPNDFEHQIKEHQPLILEHLPLL